MLYGPILPNNSDSRPNRVLEHLLFSKVRNASEVCDPSVLRRRVEEHLECNRVASTSNVTSTGLRVKDLHRRKLSFSTVCDFLKTRDLECTNLKKSD